MLKGRNYLFEVLGKLVLTLAVGSSFFVIARSFFENDIKKTVQLQEKLRESYEGLSPDEY